GSQASAEVADFFYLLRANKIKEYVGTVCIFKYAYSYTYVCILMYISINLYAYLYMYSETSLNRTPAVHGKSVRTSGVSRLASQNVLYSCRYMYMHHNGVQINIHIIGTRTCTRKGILRHPFAVI